MVYNIMINTYMIRVTMHTETNVIVDASDTSESALFMRISL
jgi:hypothetical protein